MYKKKKSITILALHLGIGGVEKYISNLCKMLGNDYKIEIISTYKVLNKPIFDFNSNIKITYLINDKPNREEFKKSLKGFNDKSIFIEGFKAIKLLFQKYHLNKNAIRKINSDFIITTRIFHNNLVNRYAKKNIIKIATEHNYHNNDNKYIKKITRSISNFNYFILVSKELKEYYENKVNPKCMYIPNVIDKIPTKASKLNSNKIISIGRLDKVKGYEDLIDVINILNEKKTNITLDLYGEGNLKGTLQEKIDSLNLNNNIKLKGVLTNLDLLTNYDLYIMTSFSESFGLVLIEAMSYGLPVVAFSSASGAKQIIKKEFGYLIDNRNKKEMANKIIEILSDESKLNKMGMNAKKESYNYLLDNIKSKWINILK